MITTHITEEVYGGGRWSESFVFSAAARGGDLDQLRQDAAASVAAMRGLHPLLSFRTRELFIAPNGRVTDLGVTA
jgi:hypothetical protein